MTEERKPNKPLIREWVEALRSGAYEQGRYWLRKNGKYCCLGVACDIYGKQKGLNWEGVMFLDQGSVLPTLVMNEFGLESASPALPYENKVDAASNLNDRGVTFPQIADLIEEKYLCPA